MFLSIIIVNWNTGGLLKQYLKNIQSLNWNFEYEIIVVDNGSKDGSVEMLKNEFPNIKLVQNKKNQGATHANNQGIKIATGKYLLLSNSDIQVPQNSIEKIIDFIKSDEHGKITIVGPRLLNPDHTRQDTCFRDILRFSWLTHLIFPIFRRTSIQKYKFAQKKLDYFLMRDKNYQQAIQVDWVLGSFMLIDKNKLEQSNIGLLDEKLHNFLWESDLGKRVRDKNMEIWYYPDTNIIHFPHRVSAGGISKLLLKKSWCHIFDWFKYFIKWRILKH